MTTPIYVTADFYEVDSYGYAHHIRHESSVFEVPPESPNGTYFIGKAMQALAKKVKDGRIKLNPQCDYMCEEAWYDSPACVPGQEIYQCFIRLSDLLKH